MTETAIIGIAGGYETDDTDTTFNGGNIDTDGFTVVAYAGSLITDSLSVDASFGHSLLDTDQFRTAAGTRITSSVDGDRTFAAANLNYNHQVNDWLLTGIGGVLWAQDKQDAFTESDGTAVGSSRFTLGRVKIGGELARTFGAFEPFVGATFSHAFNQTDIAGSSNDRSDVLLGAGARYFGSQDVSGSLELNTLLGRDDVEEHSVNFLLRANF